MRLPCILLLAAALPACLARPRLVRLPALEDGMAAAVAAGCQEAQAYAGSCGTPSTRLRLKGLDDAHSLFSFPATTGSIYNILTQKQHQLNCKFTRNPAPGSLAATGRLSACAFKHRSNTVKVSLSSLGGLAVDLNNRALSLEPGHALQLQDGLNITLLLPGTRASWAPGAVSPDTRLVLLTPDMSLVLRVPGEAQRHLDVLVASVSPFLCDMHGVLGQTYGGAHATQTQAPIEVEGADWDYEVQHLTDDAFTFNRFRAGSGCGRDEVAAGGVPAAAQ